MPRVPERHARPGASKRQANRSADSSSEGVREITQHGLTEAKSLVESAPKAVKEGINKAEAEEIKKKIEAVGGTVELK